MYALHSRLCMFVTLSLYMIMQFLLFCMYFSLPSVHVHACLSVCLCMNIRVPVCMYVCRYIRMYIVHTLFRTHARTYVRTQVRTYISYIRPVYIESHVCVVKEAVMCSFEYLCVVYHMPSLTNYIALNKRL